MDYKSPDSLNLQEKYQLIKTHYQKNLLKSEILTTSFKLKGPLLLISSFVSSELSHYYPVNMKHLCVTRSNAKHLIQCNWWNLHWRIWKLDYYNRWIIANATLLPKTSLLELLRISFTRTHCHRQVQRLQLFYSCCQLPPAAGSTEVQLCSQRSNIWCSGTHVLLLFCIVTVCISSLVHKIKLYAKQTVRSE